MRNSVKRPEVQSTFYVTGSDFAPDANKSKIFVNMKERKDRSSFRSIR